ncbi:MAG: hypothetical protein AB8G26_19075 [Ilumatobacter sp.]
MSLFTSIAKSGRPDDDAGQRDAGAPEFAAPPPPPESLSIEVLAAELAALQHEAAAERSAREVLEARLENLAARSDTPHHDSHDDESHDSVLQRIQQATDDITALVARVEDERAELRARLDRVDRRRNEAADRLEVIEARLDDDTTRTEATHSAPIPASTPAQNLPVDDESLEELEERISSALGQTELIRIEMDRFVETVNQAIDTTTARVTAVETAVQEQYQDVETAAQLERLEEVERMVLMLDPSTADTRVVPIPEPSLIGDVDDASSPNAPDTASDADLGEPALDVPTEDRSTPDSHDDESGEPAIDVDHATSSDTDDDDSVEALLAAYKGPPGKPPTPPPSRRGASDMTPGHAASSDAGAAPATGTPTLPPS